MGNQRGGVSHIAAKKSFKLRFKPRLPEGARLITQPKVSPETPFEDVVRHKAELDMMPIYLINSHGSICSSYENCRKPMRYGIFGDIDPDLTRFPEFKIPYSTYIINTTSGGEYCLAASTLSQILIDAKDEIRPFLLLNSNDDVNTVTATPFLSAFNRAATGQQYPDMILGFDIDDGQFGVFNISNMTEFTRESENTILSVADISGMSIENQIYLHELIELVYQKTGYRRGIFIVAACSGGKGAGSSERIQAIDRGEQLIHDSELSYSSVKATATPEMLSGHGYRVATNVEYPNELTVPSSETIASMSRLAGLHPQHLFNAEDPENTRLAAKWIGMRPHSMRERRRTFKVRNGVPKNALKDLLIGNIRNKRNGNSRVVRVRRVESRKNK
jgi:hypothetical protein